MKKIFLCALLASMQAIAFSQQENDFIEVQAIDTVQATPDEIIFSLILQGDPAYVDELRLSSSGHTKNSKIENKVSKLPVKDENISLIEKIIASQKIDTLPLIQYSISNEDYPGIVLKNWLLRFSSPAQLNTFIKSVAGIKRTLGLIVSKKCAQENHFNQLLIKKILEKAGTDAGYIASQSKKTIGKLLQITEENLDVAVGGWTSYPPLSALSAAMYTGGQNQSMIVITRKLRVRYSWQ